MSFADETLADAKNAIFGDLRDEGVFSQEANDWCEKYIGEKWQEEYIRWTKEYYDSRRKEDI